MRFDVLVEVQLLPGIADPQGATIERALPVLGFTGVDGLRVGKAFRFGLEANDDAEADRVAHELAERLLSNPVMESARVRLTQVAAKGASR
jgi:phosphoribosylformylglycinamidine synthase subunit PurS